VAAAGSAHPRRDGVNSILDFQMRLPGAAAATGGQCSVRTGEALRARVSRPRAGPAGSLSRIGRRACSGRLPRSSCATGAPTTASGGSTSSNQRGMPHVKRLASPDRMARLARGPRCRTAIRALRAPGAGRAIGAASSHTRRASGVGATPRRALAVCFKDTQPRVTPGGARACPVDLPLWLVWIRAGGWSPDPA